MGKQKIKNNNSFFNGLDSKTTDPNNEFFTDAASFKRGSFSDIDNTNKGVDVESYKGYLGNGVFSINSASDNTRARNQSNWEQTYNAALRFLPNVGLEILNQTGALLDVEDYVNSDKEIGNWLSNWAIEQKEAINESTPIYRENPGESLDVGDFAWWVENGSALAESVTAFAAMGAVTGAGSVKALTSGSRALKWLSTLGKASNLSKNTHKLIQGASSLNTAFLLNHAEGMGIATNVYQEIFQEELNKLQAEGKENAEELAKEKAAIKAVSALDVNKINILLNLSSASLFVKAPKLSRQLREAPSLKKSLKRINAEGLQESAEESINLIAEEQALDDSYTFNKGLQDIFSKKGLESALLGYIGGAGQTAITNGGRKIKLQRDKDGIRQSSYTLQNQAFNEQKESKERISSISKGKRIAENTDALMRAEEVFELQKAIVEAHDKKDFKKAEELKGKLLSNQAYDAFANGTTEQLINVFEGIKNLNETDAIEKGLEKETYKEKAEEAIEFIEALENEYNNSFEYLNTSDIYTNRSRNVRLRLANKKLENNKANLQTEAIRDLKELGLTSEEIEVNEKGNLVIKNTKFKEDAKKLKSVNLYANLIKNIQDNIETQKTLAKEFIELTSPNTQKSIKTEITKEKKTKKEKEKKAKAAPKKQKQANQKNEVVETITNPISTAPTEKESIETPPDSSNTGETQITPSFTFKSEVQELLPYVEGGNKVLKSNESIESKLNRLNKVVNGLEKNIQLKGVKGLLAQYKKAIRVLKEEHEAIKDKENITRTQEQAIKNKLLNVAEVLNSNDNDNAPITEEDRQKIFNKVDILIDALNTMEDAGYNTADFKTVADAMLDTVGEEKFINIFEDFKAVYNLTNKAPYKITDTYESLYLTDAEKTSIVKAKQMQEISMFLQDFYNLTNAEFKEKKDAILKKYIEEQGYTVYNKDTLNEFRGYKVVEGFNKIAYLAKRYKNNIEVSVSKFNVLDFLVSKQDIDKELNKNVDEVLLDPQYLKAGEEITFKVLDKVVYEDGTIVNKKENGNYTLTKNGEEVIRDAVDIAPIAIYYKGKPIKGAYLHTSDWINEDNIADKNDVNRQKNLIKKIRQKVLENEGTFKTTITERKDGWLLQDIKGNKDFVSKNLPKVEIAVGKDSNLFRGETTVVTSNKDIINGLPYAIIPVNHNKNIGIPVQPTKLKDSPEIINSILNAVQIYLNGKLDERADKIYTETGINLTDINDLEVFISQYIYLAPYKKDGNSFYTFDSFRQMLNQTKDTLSIVRIVDGSIQFGRGLGVNDSIGQLNKKDLINVPLEERSNVIKEELAKLKNVLENNIYINVTNELLNNTFYDVTITEDDSTIVSKKYDDFIKEHLKTDLYSATLPNGKEVYTVQGTIEFDDSFILKNKVKKEEPKITTPTRTIKKGGNDYIFGDIGNSDFELNPKTLTEEQEKELKENTPKSILIEGVPLNTQNVIIDHLTSQFLKYAIKENDVNGAFDFITLDFPEILVSAYRFYIDKYREEKSLSDLRNANIIKALQENYSKLKDISINKLKQVNNLNLDFTNKVISQIEEEINNSLNEDVQDELELDYKELNNWENDASFRENVKEKMSTNLKNFFSYIEDAVIKDNNLYPKRSSTLNIIEVVPTDIVINDLNAILAYHNDLNNKVVTEPTFKNMIEVLESWIPKKPYLYNVIEELNTNADEKLKNEFVQVMSKHYTNHLYVSQDEKGNYFVNNSDNNTIVKTIQNNWYNNIVDNGLITLSDTDEFVINNNKLKQIITNANNLVKSLQENNKNKKDLAKTVLHSLGLNFDDYLIDTLLKEGIKIKGKQKSLLSLLKDKGGALNNYINNLKSLKDKDLQINHPFKDNSALAQFAGEIGKLDPIYFANSFKDVRGKSYFGYSNNKFLVDRVKHLKNDTKGLLNKLSKQPFTSNSLWVNQLLNNPKFKEYFNYFTFDGISKRTKTDGIKLEYASPSEIEEAKLALFYSKTKYKPKNKGRVAPYIVNLFYPTTSNKTVQYGLQTLGEEWGKGLIEGKLHKRQLNKLFDIIVQPEINRILSLQNEPNKYNIKGYDKGGLMFNFIPSLNAIKDLWNEDGTLKTNIDTDIKLKHKVLTELNAYTSELVEDKLTKWEEYGFIEEAKEPMDFTEDPSNPQIYKPNRLKFSQRYKEDKYGAKKEAYNFVLNYLVANVNVFQTFTTDPAFYYKTNEWKNVIKIEKDENGKIIKNPTLDKLVTEGYGETYQEVQDYFNKVQKETKNARKELLPYYTKDNWIQEHEDIFNNIGKRLAADAAPGVDIPGSSDDTFTLAYLKDSERPVHLYSYYKAVLGANAKDYLKANSTDAQEFTTLKEHLHILNKQGKISSKDMTTILNAEANNVDFNTLNLEKEWQNLVFQPLKPVYVQNVWKSGIEHRVYVKSSSFPLFKQLTKGLEIDKLRKAMSKYNVDRVAYESAVKIGGTNKSAEIFTNKDNLGEVSDDIVFNDDNIIGTLTREGFKIQQEVPYNENKNYINDGTQQIKLLTANIRNIEGFKIPNDTDSSYTGQQIQDELDKAYMELFDINYNKLIKEVDYDKTTGEIDVNKLSEILQKEAIQRNYPLYEIEALKTEIKEDGSENFVVPLWLTGVAGKLEAMLNSIVDNRVRKLKPKGKSYVLGSSEGFRVAEGKEAQEAIKNTTGIVWDKNWYETSKGQLAPMRIKDANGKLYGENGFDSSTSYVDYAEILVPFRFKDNEGNSLDINDFTKDGFIDFDKLPKDLLNLFGFRIPTQYLNSMSAIKIVGFLPKQSGDLLLAPADWTIQMGSDFDVDKLYSNNYNTLYDGETGGLSVYREGDNRQAILENRILDLHFAILGNPNPEVQKRILKPLDFGMLKELGEELLPYVDNRIKGIGISESYQAWKYLNARAGKAGIGVFSTDNTFIAQVQNKNISLQYKANKEWLPYVIELGGLTSNFISNPKTNTNKRDKTDVISAYQSLAVDDENEQGLFKLNINNTTFDAIRTLVMSGFEEDIISYFINQPIIRRYSELKVKADDSITTFKENEIPLELLKEFPITEPILTLDNPEFIQKYGNPSKDKLISMIKGKVDNNIQQVLFKQFLEFTQFGKDIQYVQSAINTHSAGFGKDLFYSTIKEKQVIGLQAFPRLRNASNLIGEYFTLEQVADDVLDDVIDDNENLGILLNRWNTVTSNDQKLEVIEELEQLGYKSVTPISNNGIIAHTIQFIKPTTLAGIVSTNALFLNNNLWKKFFPYNNVGVNKNIDAVLTILGRGEKLSAQAINKKKAFDVLKTLIISKIANTYTDVDTTLQAERERLLLDTKENKSLATIIQTLKQTGKLNNAFINRIEVDLKKVVLPSNITYQAATAENMDERHMHSAFSAMLFNDKIQLGEFNGINYTPRKLAQDLITHQLISGGVQKATQFIKYIPITYLNSIGYYQALENINFENNSDINSKYTRNQYAQHNPAKVKLSDEKIKQLNLNYNKYNNGTIIKKKPNVSPIILPSVFSIKNNKALSGYSLYFYDEGLKGYVQKDTLGTKDILEYDASLEYGKTIIKSNKTPEVTKRTLPTKPTEIKSMLDITPIEDKGNPDKIYETNNDINSFYNLDTEGSTINKIGHILDKIINGDSDGFTKLMAEEAIKNLDKISNYELIISNYLDAKGNHSYKSKTIGLNPSAHKTKEDFEKTVLEEVIHALTKKAIIDNNTGEVARLKSLRNEAEREVLNYLNKEYNGGGQKMIDTVKNKVSNGKALTQFEADIIYPIINEEEFVGRLFKSKKLQELLNNADTSVKGKSILDNFWEFIINSLKSVGIIINKDSALEYALKDIISLINLPNPTNNQIQEVNKSTPTFRTEEFVNNLLSLVDETGEAIKISQEEANKVVPFINNNIENLTAKYIDGYVYIESVNRYEKPTTLTGYTNHSGGAIGADTEWDKIGKEFGMINNKHYYFEGYKTPNGNTAIPIKLKNEADSKLIAANNTLQRRYPTSKEYVNNLLRRNWWQVKNSDSVFAISTITDNKVDGGTGWAAHMAIAEHKPLFVFDQIQNKWFKWQYDSNLFGNSDTGKFIETTIPTLTKNFAGIGTRELNNKGKEAIRSIYKNSVKDSIKKIPNTNTNTNTNTNKKYELFPGVYANKEQVNAIDSMKDFLKPTNPDKVFTLTGRGGTGKTTIIKKILSEVSNTRNVMFVAPTHKAKNILSASVKRNASTIESALLIKLNESTGKFEPNAYARKKHLEETGVETPLGLASIIIIDEGSMVNDAMLKEITTRGESAKIIFMGDNVQLPPVKQETDSKVFSYEKAKLIERMRQGENSPIVPLTDLIANNVEAAQPVLDPIKNRITQITKNRQEGVLYVNDARKMLTEYSADIKRDPLNTKVITYNNQNHSSSQSVGNLNRILRKIVFPNSTNMYEKGEILMAYDTYIENQVPVIENSMDYMITDINQTPFTTKKSKEAYSRAKGNRVISFEFEAYEVSLKNVFTDNTFGTFLPTKESLAKHKAEIQKAFKEKDFQKGIILQSLLPNLLYGYAITSHKSQGSTYKNVYVMADNILGGSFRTNKEKSQSLYVAVSRASDKLVIHSTKNTNKEVKIIESTKDVNKDTDLNPTTEEGKARPLLLAYNNRIKNLQKNLNKAEAQKDFERVEYLKDLIETEIEKRNETLSLTSLRDKSSDNSDLYYKGIQDLEAVENMLNGNRDITLEDTLYIRKVLHFWEKATSVLFTEEDRKSKALLQDFKALETKAEVLEDKLIIYEEQFINDFIKKYGKNITVQEIFENFKDINGLTAKGLDISRSGNALLDAVYVAVKNANIDALDESNELLKDLTRLEDEIRPILKQMGHDELYEVFRQRNKNGKLTGHLVKRFSNDFSRNLYIRINALYKNNTVANFESLLEWSKDNVKIVNLDYLFSNTLSNEDKVKAEKYKQDLKQELGDKHYAEFIEKQAEQINSYKSRLSAKLRDMATKYGVKVSDIVKDSKYKKEINNWDAVNSPYKFYKHLQEKVDDVANPQISKLANFKNFNNINFVTIIPKNESAYDENYKKIENNEALLEFYNYYRKIDDTLKSYLPEDTKRTLSYTGIPFVKKTILNLYKDKGMKVGLTAIWDNISESVRSIEESTISLKSIDPVTNKEEVDLKINLSNNNSDEITKYSTLKSIDAKNKGIEVTDNLVQKWKEEKIDELAQLKSYDLAKILKVYAMTTLAYKHKSKIEDSIELAQNILNTQQEYHRTNTGEFKTDENNIRIKPKNAEQSFTNLKAQFEYFVDVFKGRSKKDEGMTKTIVLTASEKKEKKEIEGLLADLETAFNNNKISSVEYNNNKKLLQTYIDGLGGYAVNSKRGDNVLKWVQLVKMGWNIMSSIANVGFGYIANRIEASGGQLYTNEQLTKAYKLTSQSIWKNATFNTIETPIAKKIRSLMDKWDVLKDASHEMFQRPLDISLGRKLKWLSPYNVTQRTEYVNQAPILIAMMMNTSLSEIGIEKEGNLWEAYDTNGKWKPEYGEEITFKSNEALRIKRNKILIALDQVNKMNHGNYDPISALALKKEFWGRAISQFRTWMFEGYATRFENEKPDALLGTRKGRYLSVRDYYKEKGFSKSTISILKGLTRSATLGTVFKNNDFNQDGLSDVDAANMRKAMTEIAMYTTLYTSYLMLKAINDGLDDDDERKYALNLLINQGMRLKTDIMFYINPSEFKNLLRDLVPATSIITDSIQFIDAVGSFVQGEDEITTGIYSGNSRLLRESSQLLPIGTQVYKTINYGLQTFEK